MNTAKTIFTYTMYIVAVAVLEVCVYSVGKVNGRIEVTQERINSFLNEADKLGIMEDVREKFHKKSEASE